MAVARRFAVGGYRVTLVARSTDSLGDLAGILAGTGAKINTIAADASDPDGIGARMRELYLGNGAPGVIVYNAVMGAPDRLLSSSAAHLQEAYSVDVVSAIVVAQVAAPAMRAAGFGTILVTGGGFADHPIPALATVSLGKAALRQYIADIEASAREALSSINPVPYYMHYGENAWAGVKAHLDAVTEHAAAPVIAKYTGVLAAADIEAFTKTTTFAIMQSLRLDKGPSGPVHP